MAVAADAVRLYFVCGCYLPQVQNLQGYLKKMGEKGPRNSWKKRFFVQKEEYPSRLYYYTSTASANPKGCIELSDAISVIRCSTDVKKPFGFNINTTNRSYRLRATNEKELDYWVNGVASIIHELIPVVEIDPKVYQDLQNAERCITMLKQENVKLRIALQLASTQIGLSVDEIMNQENKGLTSLITKGQIEQRISIEEEEIVQNLPCQIIPCIDSES